MISSALAQTLSTILGIAITVSLILVQMTANRYIPQIIALFFRWKVYLVPLCAFIFSIIFINVSSQIAGNTAFLDLFLFFLCICLLVPYFYLLFDFLDPAKIIKRMAENAYKFMGRGKRKMAEEQIMNIGRMAKSSIQHMASEIPIVAINSEKEIMCRHLLMKKNLKEEWFDVDEDDFMGTPPQAIIEIKRNKTWVEMKIFHYFTIIFTYILNSPFKLRDVVTSMLVGLRMLGENAREVDDVPALSLSLKFFNTFCRLSLNSRDRSVMYNIFYQYRLLAEALLGKNDEASSRIAGSIKYYSAAFEDSGIPYVVEIGFYDLMMLNYAAHIKNSVMKEVLLNNFLSFGESYKNNERIKKEFTKRCLMLGGFYLLNDNAEFSSKIIKFMKEAGLREMLKIKNIENEILAITEQDFWEITDRIINFDYVDAAQREKIKEFVDNLAN